MVLGGLNWEVDPGFPSPAWLWEAERKRQFQQKPPWTFPKLWIVSPGFFYPWNHSLCVVDVLSVCLPVYLSVHLSTNLPVSTHTHNFFSLHFSQITIEAFMKLVKLVWKDFFSCFLSRITIFITSSYWVWGVCLGVWFGVDTSQELEHFEWVSWPLESCLWGTRFV